MKTVLKRKAIRDITEAPLAVAEHLVDHHAQEKTSYILLMPGSNGCLPYVTVPEGFFSIVTSYDKYDGIWKAGFHFAPPWKKIAFMVTRQSIVYDTPVKECPTTDNVMVEIDVSVVFQIKEWEEDVKKFVFNLGPEQLDDMLHAFQEEAVRTMARAKTYTSIYDLMDTEALELPEQVAKKMEDDAKEHGKVAGEMDAEPVMGGPGDAGSAIEMKELQRDPLDTNGDGKVGLNEQLEHTKNVMNEKLNPYGVEVYSITITQVTLPTEFRTLMEDATTFESKNIRAAAEQNYQLLVIGDQEKQAMASQNLVEELAQARSENEERVANEKKITDVFTAGTNAILADINEKENADVLGFQTESQLVVAKLAKEKEIELASIFAEAEAEESQIRAEMDAFVTRTRAEAAAAVAQANAEALVFQAEAENVAATALVERREFEAKMSHLRVLKNMSTNDRLAISGKNNRSVVAQMLAAKNSATALGVGL